MCNTGETTVWSSSPAPVQVCPVYVKPLSSEEFWVLAFDVDSPARC